MLSLLPTNLVSRITTSNNNDNKENKLPFLANLCFSLFPFLFVFSNTYQRFYCLVSLFLWFCFYFSCTLHCFTAFLSFFGLLFLAHVIAFFAFLCFLCLSFFSHISQRYQTPFTCLSISSLFLDYLMCASVYLHWPLSRLSTLSSPITFANKSSISSHLAPVCNLHWQTIISLILRSLISLTFLHTLTIDEKNNQNKTE